MVCINNSGSIREYYISYINIILFIYIIDIYIYMYIYIYICIHYIPLVNPWSRAVVPIFTEQNLARFELRVSES